MVIGRDGDVIGHKVPSARPVFECPLCVEGALTPAYDCWIDIGDCFRVLDGVGDVFGVDLGIAEEETGNVKIDWVGECGL